MKFEQIKEMIEYGFSTKRVAKKLQLNFKYVQDTVKDHNLQIKKETFSDNKIPTILKLYTKGVSAKNLGIKYSIDKRRIQRWAKSKGIERTLSESHRFTFFNESYFDHIDTPSKAYWLGFLYADAYNHGGTNTVSLSLQTQDKRHLHKLSLALELPTNKIIYTKTKEGYEYNTLKMYSKHLCETLSKNGCPQAKSFILKYPEWLASELNNHFIRGLFDGGGCLTFRKKQKEWKWSLASTKEMCDYINSLISENLGIHTTISYISKTNNNTYEMQTGGNEKIHKLMKWIYEDSISNIRLDRKFLKYEELVNQQNNRNINRNNYLLSNETKHIIAKQGGKTLQIAQQHNIHPKTVLEIKKRHNLFEEIVETDGHLLTSKFIRSLSIEERSKYVEPLFKFFRKQGW